MFMIQKFDDPKILGFKVDGEVHEEEIENFMKEFKAKTQQGHVRLLGKIKDIDGFDDAESFFKTVKMKTNGLGNMDKIDKYAIVTEKKWIERFVSIGDFITPNIPVRLFHEDEEQLATDWLEQAADSAYSPGIRPIEVPGHERTLGYVINGKIRAKDYDTINREFEQLKEKNEEIDLYIEFLALEGYTLKALWEDLKAGLNYYKNINKVALVSQKEWVENAAKVGDFIAPDIDMKFFKIDEKAQALHWIEN